MQIAYFSQCYPSQDVESYLESEPSVQIQKIDEGWLFDSPGNQKALIFYPGAKVDTTSYAPLLKQIASTYQVDCFLVDVPCHFVIYGMNKANQLMKK